MKKIEILYTEEDKKITVYRIEPNKTVADLLVLIRISQFQCSPMLAGPYFYVLTLNTLLFGFIKNTYLLQRSDLSRSLTELKIPDQTFLEGRKSAIQKTIYRSIKPALCHLLTPRILLNHAAAQGNIGHVQALIETKAIFDMPLEEEAGLTDIEKDSSTLFIATPLMQAAYRNRENIVKTLIAHGGTHVLYDYCSGLNPIGFAAHSSKDTSNIIFMLIAAGMTTETRTRQYYLDSHLNTRLLLESMRLSCFEGKREILLKPSPPPGSNQEYSEKIRKEEAAFTRPDDQTASPSTSFILTNEENVLVRNLKKLFVNLPFSELEWSLIYCYYGYFDRKDLLVKVGESVFKGYQCEITSDEQEVGLYVSTFFADLTLLGAHWAIIYAYFGDYVVLIEAAKKAFLEPLTNYLIDKNTSPDYSWLHFMERSIWENRYRFSRDPNHSASIAKVICQHVERRVTLTGQELSKECFQVLAELAPRDLLRRAQAAGKQEHQAYNPLCKSLLWKTNEKGQRVVALAPESTATQLPASP